MGRERIDHRKSQSVGLDSVKCGRLFCGFRWTVLGTQSLLSMR